MKTNLFISGILVLALAGFIYLSQRKDSQSEMILTPVPVFNVIQDSGGAISQQNIDTTRRAHLQTCKDTLGCVKVAENEPITIATMLTVSGPTEFLGNDSLAGIEIALNQRDDMLLGHSIVLIDEDSLCSNAGGELAAQTIIENSAIIGVIGTNCSSSALSALLLISEAGLLMISPSNTAPSLTDTTVDWQAGYFRTAHNDLMQAILAAEFAVNELGLSALATIHDSSAYSDNLQAMMADSFIELGGEVVYQGEVNYSDTDMTAILTDIIASEADIIYMPLFEPTSNFLVAQARHMTDLDDTAIFLADGSFVSGFASNTGNAVRDVYITAPALPPNDEYASFLEDWTNITGGEPPTIFYAHAYDATNMLLDAIAEVALETEDNSLLIGRQALRDAIANTENHEGMTGQLTCLDLLRFTGDCSSGESLAIYQFSEEDIQNDIFPPTIAYQAQEPLNFR